MKRQRTNLSHALEHQAKMYALAASAAGVGMLALAQPAEAKIVYTAAHRKIVARKDVLLDLNHDGIADFTFRVRSSDVNGRRGTMGTASYDILNLYPAGTANQIWGKTRSVSVLRAGVRIGPKGQFSKSANLMGGVSFFSGAGPYYFGPWASGGKSLDHRYVGLKFVINGQTHFGWARLNVKIFRPSEAVLRALLTGYAYETIPNKPIIAGKTYGNDEAQETTLGALAAGASFRARRQK